MPADPSHVLKKGSDGLARCTGCGALPHWPIAEDPCDKALHKVRAEPSVTAEQWATICQLLREGLTAKDVSKRTGVDASDCNRVGRAEGLVRNKPKTRRDKKATLTEK